MANTISKIKLDGTSIDIVPSQMTDGTYIEEIPTMSSNEYILASYAKINIPSFPTTAGTYIVGFTVTSSGLTPAWK